MDRLVKTKIEDMVRTLQECVSKYEYSMREIEDDDDLYSCKLSWLKEEHEESK